MEFELICISGPDGTGKTTQITLLIKYFKDLGLLYDYKWLRFHHLFSLPILGVARFLGLSEIVINDDEKIGYHYFYKSIIIANLYKISMVLDMLILTFFKVYIPIIILKKRIICDRFIYDTLVDVMISTGDHQFYKSFLGKFLLGLMPESSKVIIFIANKKNIVNRRKDLKYDKNLDLKIKLYQNISEEFNLYTIDASLPIDKLNDKLKEIIWL